MEIYTYRIDVYGTLPNAQMPDVTGWDVEATDGHIGKIDEATYDDVVELPRRRHRVLDLRQEAHAPRVRRRARRPRREEGLRRA